MTQDVKLDLSFDKLGGIVGSGTDSGWSGLFGGILERRPQVRWTRELFQLLTRRSEQD
jgi:hypothetical protein